MSVNFVANAEIQIFKMTHYSLLFYPLIYFLIWSFIIIIILVMHLFLHSRNQAVDLSTFDFRLCPSKNKIKI